MYFSRKVLNTFQGTHSNVVLVPCHKSAWFLRRQAVRDVLSYYVRDTKKVTIVSVRFLLCAVRAMNRHTKLVIMFVSKG